MEREERVDTTATKQHSTKTWSLGQKATKQQHLLHDHQPSLASLRLQDEPFFATLLLITSQHIITQLQVIIEND